MRKGLEWVLGVVYAAMAALCVYLNFFSRSGEDLDLANLIVNGTMFLIVAAILIKCQISCFNPVNNMIRDLERASGKMRQDALNAHQLLWEEYHRNRVKLFTDKTLATEYQDYLIEQDHIAASKSGYYKCDIEDYINFDITDRAIHRNILNQVAGVMTGLGILGTFIGLSFGLQSFNTESTSQITNSITPLMQGIKVAFHTSIYGMVFSLVFNYVYKRKIDDAESAVSDFLSNYRKLVLPDTNLDGINKLMQIEQQQTLAIQNMANTMSQQLSEGLRDLLTPQFNRFDATIREFGSMQTRNQLDALRVVVDAFVTEMNKSLDQSFKKLSYSIEQAYALQQNNASQMTEILNRTGSATVNLQTIDKQTHSVMEALNAYAGQMTNMQSGISSNVETMRRQSLDNQRYYADLNASRKSMEESLTVFNDKLEEQRALLTQINKALIHLPKEVNATFKVIDDNLVEIENHFQNTIMSIKDTTEQVPEVISDSYNKMRQSLERTSQSVEELSETVERMNGSSRTLR